MDGFPSTRMTQTPWPLESSKGTRARGLAIQPRVLEHTPHVFVPQCLQRWRRRKHSSGGILMVLRSSGGSGRYRFRPSAASGTRFQRQDQTIRDQVIQRRGRKNRSGQPAPGTQFQRQDQTIRDQPIQRWCGEHRSVQPSVGNTVPAIRSNDPGSNDPAAGAGNTVPASPASRPPFRRRPKSGAQHAADP